MLRRANKEAWRSFLASRNLSQWLVSTWGDLARPNIRLVPSETHDEDRTAIGATKLGGLPDLPAGETWPARAAYEYPKGRREYLESVAWAPASLTYLAQINLADIARNGCDLPLPDSGLLLFFYDIDTQPPGFDPCDAPGARVMFISAETPIQRCSDPPIEPLPTAPLECAPGECLPSWIGLPHRLIDHLGYLPESVDRVLDKLHREIDKLLCTEDPEALEFICYGGHVFGGWPDQIQGAMERECELVTNGIYLGRPESSADPRVGELEKNAEDWRLLLQLDADNDPWMWRWMWGNAGKLYFWCREQDIAARQFDRCWTIRQFT